MNQIQLTPTTAWFQLSKGSAKMEDKALYPAGLLIWRSTISQPPGFGRKQPDSAGQGVPETGQWETSFLRDVEGVAARSR
jgi:hypothetical protein